MPKAAWKSKKDFPLEAASGRTQEAAGAEGPGDRQESTQAGRRQERAGAFTQRCQGTGHFLISGSHCCLKIYRAVIFMCEAQMWLSFSISKHSPPTTISKIYVSQRKKPRLSGSTRSSVPAQPEPSAAVCDARLLQARGRPGRPEGRTPPGPAMLRSFSPSRRPRPAAGCRAHPPC